MGKDEVLILARLAEFIDENIDDSKSLFEINLHLVTWFLDNGVGLFTTTETGG